MYQSILKAQNKVPVTPKVLIQMADQRIELVTGTQPDASLVSVCSSSHSLTACQ